MPARIGLALWLLLGAACGSEEQSFAGEFSAPVVYGDDDRLEVYAHPDSQLADIARASVVALIDSDDLQLESNGLYSIISLPLQSSKGLCDSESFLNQPTAATCSGVLIEDDLVLTAGHCVRSEFDCKRRSYVFNYHLEGPQQLAAISSDDVYECDAIVLRDESTGTALIPDFTVIRLDRAVSGGHSPVTPRPATFALAPGEPVAMIGFGSGLPAKIDTGGEVFDPRTETLDYFVVNADAFGGHSGSPVFDSERRLIGHLVAGRGPDYVLADGQSCSVVSTYEDSQAGEAIHYFSTIVDQLCEAGIGDSSLCGEASCEGEPCGAKAPVLTGGGVGGSGVPPAPSSGGCRASTGRPAFGVIWLVLLGLGLLRLRRSVA